MFLISLFPGSVHYGLILRQISGVSTNIGAALGWSGLHLHRVQVRGDLPDETAGAVRQNWTSETFDGLN